MNIKKIGKALLYPHISVMIVLIPISAISLIYFLPEKTSPTAIASYLVSFYTLTVWCMRLPKLIFAIRNFGKENKYAKTLRENTDLRIKLSLYGSLIMNIAYSLLQLCLGFYHLSAWYFAMAWYYISLAIMRFLLIRSNQETELKKYRSCGVIFLIMNVAVSAMIFFMVYKDKTFIHHEITTIAMAAYTFTSLTMAIINVERYRKYDRPSYSAAKAISLAAACVSMLTLESTMLTTFQSGELDVVGRRLLLGITGGAVSVFIIAMAIYIITRSNKKLGEKE